MTLEELQTDIHSVLIFLMSKNVVTFRLRDKLNLTLYVKHVKYGTIICSGEKYDIKDEELLEKLNSLGVDSFFDYVVFRFL